MKLTRSFPAKASAKAKVPNSTITLNTFTFSQWSICINKVNEHEKASYQHHRIVLYPLLVFGCHE